MTPVESAPGARRDLARLEDYLDEKSERAAIAAVEKIEAGILSLRELNHSLTPDYINERNSPQRKPQNGRTIFATYYDAISAFPVSDKLNDFT